MAWSPRGPRSRKSTRCECRSTIPQVTTLCVYLYCRNYNGHSIGRIYCSNAVNITATHALVSGITGGLT
eukprot:6787220-Pyramimonas_sp.AAC.2